MSKITGITIAVYTSTEELEGAKRGSTIVLGKKRPEQEYDVQIHVPMESCEFNGISVRVNVALIQKNFESVGEMMGEAIGKELEKAFANLE